MKSVKFYKRREQSQTRLAFAESRRKMGKANLLPRDLHLQQLHQSVSLIVQNYYIREAPIVRIMRNDTLRCNKHKKNSPQPRTTIQIYPHPRVIGIKVVLDYFTNFTMQSMQIGFPVSASMNTFAGCISSRAKRSEM